MVVRRRVKVVTEDGIHARPATMLSRLAARYECQVWLVRDSDKFDCASVLDIMMIAATQGTMLTIEADGDDADDAVSAVARLIESNFVEEPDPNDPLLSGD